MRTSSPLRYPGGKSTLADLLGRIRELNALGGFDLAEPYAGGAGASLTLLYLEYVKKIYVNDLDPAVYDFWWSVINQSERFVGMIDMVDVSMTEWFKQRAIYRTKKKLPRLEKGFAAFFLNRCNRSGIIVNGGPIGGIEQGGKWKLNARFNRSDLRVRCKRVAEYRERISLSCRDGIEFLDAVDGNKTMYFIDPPYFKSGAKLYLNVLDEQYHKRLAETLYDMREKAWVLTYDNCAPICEMYSEWAKIRPYCINYTTHRMRKGTEVLIVPKWMQLPDVQASKGVMW